MTPSQSALLVLEDGTTWPGFGFGKIGETIGEVVFNTSMTGYQEIITDPSYHSQIVVMTAPANWEHRHQPRRRRKRPRLGGRVCRPRT